MIIDLGKATVLVHRIRIDAPVQTSFGVMQERPSVTLRLEDTDGCAGWGEIWCNFPSVGAEHRARLLEATVLPLLFQVLAETPAEEAWAALDERLHVLALQTGEFGPLAQCLAGVDCALHDLMARRAGLPLATYLSAAADDTIAVYASGINPDGVAETVSRALAAGYGACKVKIGFGHERDAANLHAARDLLGADGTLMADANQGWNLEQTKAFLPVANDVGLFWLEEPLTHDADDEDWREVAAAGVAIAAGENFSTPREFSRLPEARRISVLQPDLGKFGGIGQCFAIGREAARQDRTFCPHWLGGPVGLLHSCHLKSAVGGATGYVEVDFNANAFREALTEPLFATLADGRVRLPSSAGIGIEDPDFVPFDPCLTLSAEVTG